MTNTVTASQFEARDDLPDWRYLVGAIEATFRTGSFEAATRLAMAIAAAAEVAEHHPDIDIRYPDRVHVVLTTHAAGHAVTDLDLTLAATISQLAADARATSDPLAAQVVELALDVIYIDAIKPFWAAVLGYTDGPPNSDGTVTTLVDPARIGPPLWFQQMDIPRDQRNRFHVDISVASELAPHRIAEAVDAGGRLISDEFAPSWWVLADAEGNEACVCTCQGRG